MQRVEKECGSVHQSSHCFPSIEKTLAKTTDQHPEDDNAFRPLFQVPNNASGRGPHGDENDSSNDTLEQIKEKRFLEGLEAGKIEACKIVQQELDSPIRQFLNQNDSYSNSFTKITDNYSDRIVELALAIAQKIWGDPSQFNMACLEPIRSQLHTLLKQRYRLSVTLNRDDIASLSGILACVRPQWTQSDALNISGSAETPKGQMQLENPDEMIETLKDRFNQEVEELLSDL